MTVFLLLPLPHTAARDGYDSQHGGVYESPSSKTKIWWVQNEAMLGLWTLHKHLGGGAGSGSSAKVGGTSYLQQLAGTSKFLRQHQTDNAVAGEQFWQVCGALRVVWDGPPNGWRWRSIAHVCCRLFDHGRADRCPHVV